MNNAHSFPISYDVLRQAPREQTVGGSTRDRRRRVVVPKRIFLLGLDDGQLSLARRQFFPNSDILLADDREELLAMLDQYPAPLVVVVPLIARQWDAMDIAGDLLDLKRDGLQLQVVACDVPNPKMVLSELRRKSVGIHVDLLDMTSPPCPRLSC